MVRPHSRSLSRFADEDHFPSPAAWSYSAPAQLWRVPIGSVIREFAARPNVLLVDEHFFESLERPELFADGMHMNKSGVALFSAMLAREIGRMLGPPR